MKAFSVRTFTPWWLALLSLLVLAGCGSDDNPISPTTSQVSQVNSVNSLVPQNVFSGTLTGTEQVPSVTSNGSGTGIVSVDPATNQMKATIVTADITGTQAHIHLGASGIVGPVVFPMTESEAGSGVWTTTVTLTSDQLNQLKTGNYYFNVHTTAFPEGEIRGQILAQLPQSGSPINTTSSTNTGTSTGMSSAGSSGVPGTQASDTATNGGSPSASSSGASTTGTAATVTAATNRAVFYTNVLSGSLVVPPNASTASAAGIAAYRPNNGTLTAVIVSTGLTTTAANIRQAAAGTTGPIVGSFTETSAGSGIWVLRATLNATQAEALNNGAMYYELLSTAFPEGELRGQVARTPGTTTPAIPATAATPAAPGTPTTQATPSTGTTSTTPTTLPTGTTPITQTTPPTGTTLSTTEPTTITATTPATIETTTTTPVTTTESTTTSDTTTSSTTGTSPNVVPITTITGAGTTGTAQ